MRIKKAHIRNVVSEQLIRNYVRAILVEQDDKLNICKNCSKDTVIGKKFCTNCGYPQCSKCGVSTTPNKKFCTNCGAINPEGHAKAAAEFTQNNSSQEKQTHDASIDDFLAYTQKKIEDMEKAHAEKLKQIRAEGEKEVEAIFARAMAKTKNNANPTAIAATKKIFGEEDLEKNKKELSSQQSTLAQQLSLRDEWQKLSAKSPEVPSEAEKKAWDTIVHPYFNALDKVIEHQDERFEGINNAKTPQELKNAWDGYKGGVTSEFRPTVRRYQDVMHKFYEEVKSAGEYPSKPVMETLIDMLDGNIKRLQTSIEVTKKIIDNWQEFIDKQTQR